MKEASASAATDRLARPRARRRATAAVAFNRLCAPSTDSCDGDGPPAVRGLDRAARPAGSYGLDTQPDVVASARRRRSTTSHAGDAASGARDPGIVAARDDVARIAA